MAFNSFAESPFQIKTEGEQIVITFKEGSPEIGQGTVTWTIPPHSHGCASTTDGRDTSYCGMVVLLANTPMNADNIPLNGEVYEADPTADSDVHAGDTIGGALVIGAFYEGQQKHLGEDLTTTFVISGLSPDTPYYVAGYAVDCQYRYHSDGVRAYSDRWGNEDTANMPSTQLITVEGTVSPSTGTLLVPGFNYEFELLVNNDIPTIAEQKQFVISFDGIEAGTYGQMLDEINRQILLADNPPQSPLPPNYGQFYWNGTELKLYQFDGYTHNLVEPTLVEATDPTVIVDGTYWHNTVDNTLWQWGIPTAAQWNAVNAIDYGNVDPTAYACDDYWFNGTQGYRWNGSTWCEVITYVSDVDPASCPVLACGTYWYDETNAILSSRDMENNRWVEQSAIHWNVSPDALVQDTYWFDIGTDTLFQLTTTPNTWTEISESTPPGLSITDTEPVLPADGHLWYSPTNETLSSWDETGNQWVDIPVLVWDGDPTDVTSCELWWDSVNDTLHTWDVVNSEWDQVVAFIQSTIDPAVEPVIPVDSVWYDIVNLVLKKWDGAQWLDINYVNHATDPTYQVTGDAWYNSSTSIWSIWDTPVASQWNIIDPVDSDTDPSILAASTYWYDTTNAALFMWNGASWQSVLFSTSPLVPTDNQVWFDSDNGVLYTWDGTTWVIQSPLLTFFITDSGNVAFETYKKGSNVCAMIIDPKVQTGSQTFYFSNDTTAYAPATTVDPEVYLFDHLAGTVVYRHSCGSDGLTGNPSYEELGVGDDGTPDERRELMDSVRAQLGYPTVDVELTPYQMDTAVTRALESFRKRSATAYTRGFFFLDLRAYQQSYILTSKRIGYNKIVSISAAQRFTSAFLSSAHGAGVYGQIILQHLYNMGTYDLTSFFLVSQYVEQMEHLFSTRLTYHWDETTRRLDFYQSFARPETILLDCMIERSEQDILKDRWAKNWIEKYALAEAMLMLSQIRGKYATLPGAGGGVSLNAADLMTQAAEYKQDLYQQLEDFVANNVEELGMHSTLIIG